MNGQLENAIQEAMAELDKMADDQKQVMQINTENSSGTQEKPEQIGLVRPPPRAKTHPTPKRPIQVTVQNSTAPKQEEISALPSSGVSSGLRSSNTTTTRAPSTRLRRSQR